METSVRICTISTFLSICVSSIQTSTALNAELSILLAHNKLEKNGEAAFDYKPVQLGLAVGVGAEIRRNWQLTGSYTWDMTGTMSATKLDKFESHNRTWKVALTYFF